MDVYMSIISEVKCARCDRKYSGVRSRCPYCGARRIGRGKYSEDSDNSRGKMLIGIMIMAVLVVGAGILLFTAPGSEAPDQGVAAQTPPSQPLPDEGDNFELPGLVPVDPPQTSEPPGITDTAPPAAQVRSVAIVYGPRKIVKTDITEKIGVKIPLRVDIEPVGVLDEIIWTSSNPAVFEVTVTNTECTQVSVTGLTVGTATLTVAVGGEEAKCIIRIKR